MIYRDAVVSDATLQGPKLTHAACKAVQSYKDGPRHVSLWACVRKRPIRYLYHTRMYSFRNTIV